MPLDSSNTPKSKSRALQTLPPAAPPEMLLRRDASPRHSSLGENPISPAFLLWVFQQWWKVGIPAGIALASLVGAVVWWTHVPRYEARALLNISDNAPYVAFNVNGGESGRYIQTQLALLRSVVIIRPVISQPEIGSLKEIASLADPIEELGKRIVIKPLGSSEMYYVCYTGADPKNAAAIVNAIVTEYLDYTANDEKQRSQKVIDILEVERGRRALEVERLRKQLVALAEDATGKDPYTGNARDLRRTMNPIGSLFENLTELDLEREMLKAQKELLAKPAASNDPFESSGLLRLEIDNHAETRRRLEAIAEIKLQMEDIKAESIRNQKNPQWKTSAAYVALEKDLAQREQEVVAFREQLRKVLIEQHHATQQVEREQELTKVERQLELLDSRRQLLTKRFNDQLDQVKSGEGKSVQLEFARAELAREEKVFEMIAQRTLSLQTELRAPARIKLQFKADVPGIPIEPIPYKKLFVACIAALGMPFGLALAKEVLVRRISDVDQLAQETRLRVLGEIAELPVRHVAISPNKMTGRLQREAHVFAESINSLRTNLTVADDLRDKQVIAIVSSTSGESKSSVATSLAMSIANAAATPTLIIDGDLRSPDVAAMLKTKAQPGLYDVLAGRAELEDAIQHVGDSQLYVLPAGRVTGSTHHVMRVGELRTVIDKLRPKFATIIIDTPPILGASESLVIAKVADAAVFCTLSGVSKVKQVHTAVERLEHAGVDVAGAVLSGSAVKRYAYRYGYYPVEERSHV